MNEIPADHATPPDPAPRRQAAIVAFLGAGIELVVHAKEELGRRQLLAIAEGVRQP